MWRFRNNLAVLLSMTTSMLGRRDMNSLRCEGSTPSQGNCPFPWQLNGRVLDLKSGKNYLLKDLFWNSMRN